MSDPLTVAITGANGFIGGNLAGFLQARGTKVIALGRREVDGLETRRFTLGEPLHPQALSGVDALVHCAYDFSVTRPVDIYLRNVVGAADLLHAAATSGVRRIVHVSSMSAYAGTGQLYGRSKLEIERLVTSLGGVSLRLGLVWSGQPGGMAGTVQRLSKLPVVPLIGKSSIQFLVHEDDATLALAMAIDQAGLSGVLGVAAPEPVRAEEVVAGLARLAGTKPGHLVGVPWRLVYHSMRLAEAARIPLPLRADSVLGLVRPAPDVPRVEKWAELGLEFRRLPSSTAA